MGEHDPRRRVAQYRIERLAEADLPDGDEADPAEGDARVSPPAIRPGDDATGVDPRSQAPVARGDARPDAGPGVDSDAADGDTGAGEGPDRPRPTTMAARAAFADELVRQAMARGDFDDLPLTGKPIPGLTGRYDPDWWIKAFIEREQITGVLPEALQLRKDDAELDDRLDDEYLESRVREVLDEFNARVVEARRQLLGGPPVVTPTRDVEAEVTRWRERRRAREAATAAASATHERSTRAARRTAWWRRR